MFGYHAAKRANRRLKREKQSFQNEKNQLDQNDKAHELQNEQAKKRAGESKIERQAAREEGRSDTEAFFRKDHSGLGISPEQRSAMQFEANKAIHRGHQSANRKLLGEQSQKGIRGSGGVGYAQQRDLHRMAQDAKAGVDRDLTKLDKDTELKKMAAIFTGGEGHAAQAQLDKQLALDELQLAEEKRKAKKWEEKFNQTFSRI